MGELRNVATHVEYIFTIRLYIELFFHILIRVFYEMLSESLP